MSPLLDQPPYAGRDEAGFLAEMNALTWHHLAGCPEYPQVWPGFPAGGAARVEDLPFLHVGLFKHLALTTRAEGLRHERTLLSSATTGGNSSRIVLDADSSALQSRSSQAILEDFLGPSQRQLLVLDHPSSLRRRGEVSARVAAAMSLRPLARDIHFLLATPEEPASLKTDALAALLAETGPDEGVLIYGFTWMLHLGWRSERFPDALREALRGRRVDFVHSGGWKKLESLKVGRAEFDARLLDGLHPASRVLDFYGLVEQVGIVYPLCPAGFRHVPRWADVLARDPFTAAPLGPGAAGQLQLLNAISRGAPYHSVLTEDLAALEPPGDCPCGRAGKRFTLLGRVPKAESRGCANV